MHLHFDPVGGAAGDMFIAALLHAFPEHRDGLFNAVRAAGVPRNIGLRLIEHTDDAMSGLRFDVLELPDVAEWQAAQTTEIATSPYRPVAMAVAPALGTGMGAHGHAHTHTHGAAHSHPHAHAGDHTHDEQRRWADIRAQLTSSALALPVLRHALGIFQLIADAEAQVHGVAVDAVAFHEVGAWDSIADVVGAAFLIDAIAATSYSCAALPLGSGRVQTAHGLLPVPVPATALLLQGLTTTDDGRAGERVTPTGAAILRYLNPAASPGTQARKLARSGTGFGTKRFAGISNVLRALVFETAEAARTSDQIEQIEFEVDDQTAEDLAVGLEHLRAHVGVLDVVQAPVFGKKGRIATHVRVLALPAHVDAIVRACFEQTTTIGLRHQRVQRTVLTRASAKVRVGEESVAVKIVERPSGSTGKTEMDAIAHLNNREARANVSASAVRQALAETARDDPSKTR